MGIGTFTNLGVTQFGGSSIDVPAYEGFVEPTSNGLMDLLQESTQDFYQLQAALYVADVVHEQATLESAQDAEAIFESVVKDSLAKLKKIFSDMWAKVKSWFASVIQRAKLLFQSGEKFINANKKQLDEKNVLGFKYKGYKWDVASGQAKAEHFVDLAKKSIEQQAKVIDFAAKQVRAPKVDGSAPEGLDEVKEKVFNAMGVEDISEMKKEIYLAARSGEEEAKEIEDFSANSKAELMELVKNSSKAISAIEKAKKATDAEYQRIIKALDAASKAIGEGGGDDKGRAQAVNIVNRAAKMVQFLLTIISAADAALIDNINTSAKAATATLKKYLTYKPAKESYTGEGDGDVTLESMSILDRAMKLV